MPKDDGDSEAAAHIQHSDPVHESVALRWCTPRPPSTALDAAALTRLSPMQRATVRSIMAALSGPAAAFALGDGTGVGKSRCIAAAIWQWRTHRRAAADRSARVLWMSANCRLQGAARAELAIVGHTAVGDDWFRFASYASMHTDATLEAMHAWLAGSDAPPLIILDECHMLRSLRRLYASVIRLIGAHARRTGVLYSSATMMSDATHLSYLTRLPLFGAPDDPFDDARHMKRVVGSCPAALELVAMHLMARGLYVSRQLSVGHVEIGTQVVPMSAEMIRLYDMVVVAANEARIDGGTVQRTLLRLVTAMKTRHAIADAEDLLRRGFHVVFSLCRTGGACTTRCIHRSRGAPATCIAEFAELVSEVHEGVPDVCTHADEYPLDATDQIVRHFGPSRVAEITGRAHRFVPSAHGAWKVQRIRQADELRAFTDGVRRVAILSRAGGLGMSLHDTVGTRRRANIVLELPWNAEDLVQSMGRVHRCGGRSVPLYRLCVLDMPGEHRVAHTLSRRIASMGALTRGDRYSCDTLRLLPQYARGTTASERRHLALTLATGQLVRAWRDVVSQWRPEAWFANVAEFRDTQALVRRYWHAQSEHSVFYAVLSALRAARGDSGSGDMASLLHAHAHTDMVAARDDASSDGLWPHAARLLTDLLMVYPRSCTPAILPHWSPERHFLYDDASRARVLAVLSAHAHPDARDSLGMLPDALVHQIIEHMLDDRRNIEVASASFELADLEKLYCATTREGFYNTMLRLPVRAQRGLHGLMGSPTAHSVGSLRDIREVASARAGRGVDVVLAQVGGADADGRRAIRFEYRPAAVASPPPGASIWRSTRSNCICWAGADNDRHARTVDGRDVALDPASSAYTPCTVREWDESVRRYELKRRARIRRMHRTYVVSTHNALYHWERSLKTIVSVPVDDTLIVALLVSTHV